MSKGAGAGFARASHVGMVADGVLRSGRCAPKSVLTGSAASREKARFVDCRGVAPDLLSCERNPMKSTYSFKQQGGLRCAARSVS